MLNMQQSLTKRAHTPSWGIRSFKKMQSFSAHNASFQTMNLFSEQINIRNQLLQQLNMANLGMRHNLKSISQIYDIANKYKSTIQNYLDNTKSLKLPSEDIINATLQNELTDAGFFDEDVAVEQVLDNVESKIRGNSTRSEWLNALYAWIISTIINYVIALSVNYSQTNELTLLTPSFDVSTFIAMLFARNNPYRYVKKDGLEIKIISKHQSKTVGRLEIEEEVIVIRVRKDWSFIEVKREDEIIQGWVLTRYLSKR